MSKVKSNTVSAETRQAILDIAWRLIEKRGTFDIGLADIAGKAGVSRQTLYLAFGSRAGLLSSMLRNKDKETNHVARLRQIAERAGDTPSDFLSFVEVWLDYLPHIYPVGILLDAASVEDEDAATAWNDRMKKALLGGLKYALAPVQKAGRLAPGWTAPAAAELVWSLVHPVSRRLLVAECGWTEKDFRRNRIELIRQSLFAGAQGARPNARRRR